MHVLRTLRSTSRLRPSQNAAYCAATFKHGCNCTTTATASAIYSAPTEAHMQHLASLLAQERGVGDTYCLSGSVGAGKSVFSRAFIRAACDDQSLPVPSPTYLLQLVYEDQEGPPIHHFDLYRLDPQSDMNRLDLNSSFQSAVSLVEWSDRLPQQLLPQQRLELRIEIAQEDGHRHHHHHHHQQQQRQGASWQKDCTGQQQQQQQQQQPDQGSDVKQQATGCIQPTAKLQMPHQKQQRHTRQATGSNRDEVLVLGMPDLPKRQQQHESWDTGEELYSDAEDEYEESAGGLFTDLRPRRVELTAVGERWVARLQQLAVQLP